MKNWSKLFLSICILTTMLLSSCGTSKKLGTQTADMSPYPKREFRGAWIHTVSQSQYAKMSVVEMKLYFIDLLNKLQKAGVNAVVFQVRPQADAFYKSNLEPWSRYLTGEQGKAPAGDFDPLSFMIEECHKRNMELHAWLNPYRVTNSESQVLASNHIYHRHPERFVKYGTQMYFDPGIPENREFICEVVRDIVIRYQVDAIHMDDYFYPYPITGVQFPDDRSFNQYAASQGFSANQRDDWRRNNVNMLIKELHETIQNTKPWVRFGISPFGIYRNKRSTPDGSGSETNGLQNYDDLYADVLHWVKEGWIDYDLPQLYWEIGHTAADYKTLITWWANNSYGRHLYIGQDIKRTMDKMDANGENQLREKMELSRSYPSVHGNCFWPGYLITSNYKGVANELEDTYHRYPALVPAYTHMYNKTPKKVKNVEDFYTQDKHLMTWSSNHDEHDPTTAQYYVVYRFAGNTKKIDLNNPQNIVAITRNTFYELPYEGGNTSYRYVITAVDAFNNESKGQTKKLKL